MITKIKQSLNKHQSSIEELDKLMSSQEVISLLDEEDVISKDNVTKQSTARPKNVITSRIVVILGTGLKSDMVQQLYLAEEKLGAKIVSEFTKDVSHVVACVDTQNCIKRTMKYFLGLMHKKWIVSFNCKILA
jgi:galactose-1-phosphate uridylyltransferase